MRLVFTLITLLVIGFGYTSFSQNSEGQKIEYVSFTLENTSTSEIKLFIPGVMNPNLSPKGKSGVTLKIGQEILFKYNRKKQTLLVANKTLKGMVLNVEKLMKERQKEIDLEN